MKFLTLAVGVSAVLLMAPNAGTTSAIGGSVDFSFALAAKAYPMERDLGGVDLSAYCHHKGYEDTKLVNNTGYGWVCYRGNEMVAISMTEACQWTYGPGAIDRMGDYNNPNSWQCWR